MVASTEPSRHPVELDHSALLHIAVLGDFSGRAWHSELADRRPIRVDRDNFDEVMAGLKVELHLDLAGKTHIDLAFRELDDFHPDRLYERVDVFRTLREKLKDPAASDATVRPQEPSGFLPDVSAPPPDLLDRVIGESQGRRMPDSWAAYLEQITAPYQVAADDPRQAERVGCIEAATGQLMRNILHHPDFQALEAAWRSLHFLVRRLETDERLTLSLVDVTREELGTDEVSALLGRTPWSLLVCNLTFGPSALLGRLAEVARGVGAPLVAAASPRILGCESLAATPDPEVWAGPDPAWEALRRHPDASYIGLALPRFLLRLPYGREESSIESFDFEELANVPEHEALLWGNPAFLVAEILGEGKRVGEVEGLPLHVSRQDGEAQVTPCAEVILSDRAVERILDCGLMPVLSQRNRDVVRIARIQSIAEPASPLAGRWNS